MRTGERICVMWISPTHSSETIPKLGTRFQLRDHDDTPGHIMIVPGIFSTSSSIIIAIFVTVRYTEIPILIYKGAALIWFSFVIISIWFEFEVLTVIRSLEDIVQMLNNIDQPYFLQLPIKLRLYLSKSGKATRPAIFNIGDFTYYSIGVVKSMWDEIINQLIFLLTF